MIDPRKTTNDLFDVYLRDISDTSILSREDELKIAKAIMEKRRELNKAIFSSYSAVEALIKCAEEIGNHKINIEHILILSYPKKRKIYFQRKRYDFLRRVGRIKELWSEWENIEDPVREKIAKRTVFFNLQHQYIKGIIENEKSRHRLLSLLYTKMHNGKKTVKEVIKTFENKHRTSLNEIEERLKHIDTIKEETAELKSILIQSNMRLVISIAKHYRDKGVELSDLIQEGNRALIKAIDRFDYRYGYRFSSYAVWWIKQALNKIATEQAKALKIPTYVMDMYYKILRAKINLTQELERPPTLEEISKRSLLPIKKIQFIFEMAQESISLDSSIKEGENAHIGDFIEDVDSPNPAEEFARKMLRKRLYELLKDLKAKERIVLELRYGLIDGVPRTLEDVGGILDLTRERVRQIQKGAIRKLSKPFRTRKLNQYYEVLE